MDHEGRDVKKGLTEGMICLELSAGNHARTTRVHAGRHAGTYASAATHVLRNRTCARKNSLRGTKLTSRTYGSLQIFQLWTILHQAHVK